MTYHSSVVLKLLKTLMDRPEEAGRCVDKDKYSCYTLEIVWSLLHDRSVAGNSSK